MHVAVACRYYQDVCLLEQPFVVDDSQRVQDVIKVRQTLHPKTLYLSDTTNTPTVRISSTVVDDSQRVKEISKCADGQDSGL